MSREEVNTIINAMNVTLGELERSVKQLGNLNDNFLRSGSDILGKVRYQEFCDKFDEAVQQIDVLQDQMGRHSFAYESIPALCIPMWNLEHTLKDKFSLEEVYTSYRTFFDEPSLEILAYYYYNHRGYLTQEDKDFLKENDIELKL